MASALAQLLQATRGTRRPATIASVAGDGLVFGTKPPLGSFGGADDGRPIASVGGGVPASTLSMNGGNPVLDAIKAAPGMANLPARAARRKDPRAQYRRFARSNFARERGLADNDWRTWSPDVVEDAQEMGILPGGDFGQGGRPKVSAGSQLANLRWHGNPDGPVGSEVEDVDLDDELGEVNAIRAAALAQLRRGARPTASRR
jgi:hypothetical protein